MSDSETSDSEMSDSEMSDSEVYISVDREGEIENSKSEIDNKKAKRSRIKKFILVSVVSVCLLACSVVFGWLFFRNLELAIICPWQNPENPECNAGESWFIIMSCFMGFSLIGAWITGTMLLITILSS